MTLSKEHNQVPNTATKGNAIRFVESLADAQDYWMSLTDAARVTRTSEAMTRRWVSSGRLPVKQEPVGINQRTRLVRASDVARLRPIVDPTAAITDEIHKLDLLSIPRQQAQITETQGRILELIQGAQHLVRQLAEETQTALAHEAAHLKQQVQTWNQRLTTQSQTVHQALQVQQQQHEALVQQVGQQAQEIQRTVEWLRSQQAQEQQDLERVQIQLTAQIEALVQQVERLDQDYHAREERARHAYTVLLHQQEFQFRQALQGIEETLANQDQERTQIRQYIASLEHALGTLQQTISAQVEQQIQEIRAIVEQRRRDETEEKAALTARLGNLEEELQRVCFQIESICSGEQEHAKAQEQQMQTLAVQLQKEIDARRALLARFDAQSKQRNA